MQYLYPDIDKQIKVLRDQERQVTAMIKAVDPNMNSTYDPDSPLAGLYDWLAYYKNQRVALENSKAEPLDLKIVEKWSNGDYGKTPIAEIARKEYGLNNYPDWEPGKDYVIGDRMKYNGATYEVVQSHTSQSDWTPDTHAALYKEL